MRRILLAVISLLPVLSYGQSMKIAPKQIEPGDNDGKVIITRNGVNVLDSIKWTDVKDKPNDLEHTSNKINGLGSNLDDIHYISGKAIDEWGFIFRGFFSGNAINIDNTYKSGFYSISGTPDGTLPTNFSSASGHVLRVFNQGITSSSFESQELTEVGGRRWHRQANYQGVWGDWLQYADRDWVNNQGFLTSETDPVYTADKGNLVRKYNTDDVFSLFPGTNKDYQGSVVESNASAANTPPGESYFTGINLMPNHNANFRSILGVATSGKFYIAKYSNSSSSWSWRRMITEGDDNTLLNNAAGYITAETDPVYTADKPNIIFSGDNNSLLNNDAGYITSASIPTVNDATLTMSTGTGLTGSQTFTANSATNKTFTVGLSPATATTIGGVELASNTVQSVAANSVSATSGRTYGVQLNSAGQAVVNVPWTDNNTTYSAGTGLSLSGTTFNNTAPDKTVVLNTGTGISVSGTYPNFTITNTAPNQNYTLPTASASVLGGIKVGNNLSISSGVLSADVGTNDLFSGSYNDLTNKPTIPTVNNATLTLATGSGLTGSQTFTANSSTNKTFTVGLNAALNNLNDVSAASPSSGQLLRYNGSNWTNWTPSFLTSFTETDPVYTADKPTIFEYKGANPGTDAYTQETGSYYLSSYSGTHSPDPSNVGVMAMFKGNSRFVALYARQNTTDRPKIAWGITGGSTSDWKSLAFTDDIPTNNNQLTNGAGYITSASIPTVNDATLTLNTSGIATGSTTFSANQSNNSSVTVNVPGTNLGGSFNSSTGALTVTSSTGSNATISMPVLQSGTYTPTISSTSGIANSQFPADLHYSRVGDVVTVSGYIQVQTLATTGEKVVEFSPPIASGDTRAAGTATISQDADINFNGVIEAEADHIKLSFYSNSGIWDAYIYFTFQYVIN